VRKKLQRAASGIEAGCISESQVHETLEKDAAMTKIATFAVAFLLFAPLAVAILMQAAKIVA
jgi:hypothetical protein